MTQQEFESFFTKTYVEVTYLDVKIQFEEFYNTQDGKLFHDDYLNFSKTDFIENLSDDAKFQFQDILLEAFYDKNPQLYEQAFAIFESNGGKKTEVTKLFDDTYKILYESFLGELFLTYKCM